MTERKQRWEVWKDEWNNLSTWTMQVGSVLHTNSNICKALVNANFHSNNHRKSSLETGTQINFSLKVLTEITSKVRKLVNWSDKFYFKKSTALLSMIGERAIAYWITPASSLVTTRTLTQPSRKICPFVFANEMISKIAYPDGRSNKMHSLYLRKEKHK